MTFTYDAWNRLVEVQYDEVERARYDYNGLSWRIAKTAYMVEATAFWQKRLMYYNHNWQLLEEHIDDDFDDHEGFDPNRHMQYVWGVRYIDDIVLRRQDSNLDDTLDKTWYHCTDTLFSTVVILDHTAKLVERVSYDAYGNARHHRMGDLNGDGAVDISDQLLLFGAWGDGGVGDLNRDGASDVSDLLLLQGSWGPAQPAGRISAGSSGTDNIIGYAGYVFNPEMHGSGLYLARNRYYDPELSRWLTRDPIGYVDGMNVYQYSPSSPLGGTDPMGTDFGNWPGRKPPGYWVTERICIAWNAVCLIAHEAQCYNDLVDCVDELINGDNLLPIPGCTDCVEGCKTCTTPEGKGGCYLACTAYCLLWGGAQDLGNLAGCFVIFGDCFYNQRPDRCCTAWRTVKRRAM